MKSTKQVIISFLTNYGHLHFHQAGNEVETRVRQDFVKELFCN